MVEQDEAESELGKALRAQMSDERWRREVKAAHCRAAVLAGVTAIRQAEGLSWRLALAAVAPEVSWSTFSNWRRKHERRNGPSWERLLDERSPPSTALVETIAASARELREIDQTMTTATARAHLIKLYGEHGAVSDTKLRRIWAVAGLNNSPGPSADRSSRAALAPGEREEVEFFSGGAGLALLQAADVETGTTLRLAQTVMGTFEAVQPPQHAIADDSADRDARGRFTADYNARHRQNIAAGEVDDRWSSDAVKAAQRDLTKLRTGKLNAANLATKLFAMGTTPLLTERRGFDGLASPAGGWLGLTGAVAYMPTTLDKLLAELGLLNVGDALWNTHAEQWSALTRRWSTPGPDWLQTIAYIDGTADPYWTRAYALSGKVSKVGRVMPCLTRMACNGGAGVPLLVETFAGSASMKRSLSSMLTRLRAAVGPDAAVDRLTVVDSEAGKAGVLWALHQQQEVMFVSVLKGAVLAGANLQQEGPWQRYRERDELCESGVVLFGKDGPAAGLPLRAVQMRRPDSRNPHTSVYVTNASTDDLPAADLVSLYLSRWPQQEQSFRDGRNGGGLNRSFGYGREQVTHVALADKQARASRGLARAEAALHKAKQTRDRLVADLAGTPAETRKAVLALATSAVRRAEQQLATRQAKAAQLSTQPATIQQRDIGRDSIMTCLKVSTLALTEYILKEYFGGLRAEWRTFIESLVALSVTMRTTKTRRLFRIHPNPRQPQLMTQLAEALVEVNRREIRQGRQLLIFELAGGRVGPCP